MSLSKYFKKALEYENYIDLLGENLKLHKLHYSKFHISDGDKQKIKQLNNLNILVITEPWCGDSLALLPIVKKISELNNDWKLKISLRDKNPELIDQLLTRGGRAIPIFLFLNESFELIFKWGPRPAAAQNIFDQYRDQIQNGKIEKSQVILKIRQFYARDKGVTTFKELSSLLYTHLK